jgi:hypothetical protein
MHMNRNGWKRFIWDFPMLSLRVKTVSIIQLQKMFVFGYTLYATPFPQCGSYILLKSEMYVHTLLNHYQDEVVNVKMIQTKCEIKNLKFITTCVF